jgi:peptide-methionine (S)-S-oxide reductase
MIALFLELHTPTDPKWAGTQYRSAIFVYTDEQRRIAEQALSMKGGPLGKYVAIEDASHFYRAEEYHQRYIEKAMMGRS